MNNEKTIIEVLNSEEKLKKHIPKSTIFEYEIIEELDSNGFEADTFIVKKDNNKYFMKLYRKGLEPKEDIVNKIIDLSKLYNDDIIQLIEYGYYQEKERWYEIQEYAKYGTLEEFMKTSSFNKIKKYQIMKEIIKALSLLHKNDLIHLDIKPSNILVKNLEPVNLVFADFGISSLFNSEEGITKHTTVRGTPAYWAPESFTGNLGKKSDVWAVGIIFYEILFEILPFKDMTYNETIFYLATKEIELPETANKKEKILMKGLLNRNPEDRWGIEELELWINDKEILKRFSSEDEFDQNIRKQLSIYKERLINLSGRNQTLCRNKIYKKRAFDLVKLNKICPNICDNILLSLIKDDSKEHLLFNYHHEFPEENKQEKLIDDYLIHLLYLFDEIDSKERETGLYELYIGYPFIEGRLKNGKNIRAPLFLFPSKIFNKNKAWYYQNLNRDKIFINKTFILSFSDSVKKSVSKMNTEFETVEEFFDCDDKINTIEDFQKHIFSWGEKNGISLSNELFSKNLELYTDYTAESFEKYQAGDLFLKNQLIMGQYSIVSNGIYQDYNTIIKSRKIPRNIELFFSNNKETSEEINDKSNSLLSVNENNNFFVTNLDFSQEKAVLLSEIKNNLVISGPPGTGKSQVIVNIITNYLAKNKKVLVVSEKRTALDVVAKRIEERGLIDEISFVHDVKKDRTAIMNKIIKKYDNVIKDNLNDNKEINSINKEINSIINKFDKLANELHKIRDCGISLYDLYINSQLSNNILNELSDNFNYYKNIKFNDLLNTISKLKKLETYLFLDNKKEYISHRKTFKDFNLNEKDKILSIITDVEEKINQNIKMEYYNSLNLFINSVNLDDKWKSHNDIHSVRYDNITEIINIIKSIDNTFFISIKRFKLKKKLKLFFKKTKFKNIKEISYKINSEHLKIKDISKKLLENKVDILDKVNELLKINLLDNEDMKFILERKEIISDLRKSKEKLKIYFESSFTNKFNKDNSKLNLKPLFKIIKDHFNKILELDKSKETYEKYELNLLKLYSNNNDNDFLNKLKTTFCLKWIEEYESNNKEVLDFINIYKVNQDTVNDLINKKKNLMTNYIIKTQNKNVEKNFRYNRLGNEIHFRDLLRESKKKRRILSLRTFIQQFDDTGLFDLLPCWLMTPEVVSEILPLKKDMFDIIIFDEASQIFIEKCIPAIYRAKKVVLAGDEKQLQPSILGIKKIDDNLASDNDMIIPQENVISVLDIGKMNYNNTLLNYHYRSKHSELINFSNYAFYNGNLLTAPKKEKNISPPIEYIKVKNGIWSNQKNELEAKEVVSLVKKILFERKNNETIGIVSFNEKQRELIKSSLYFESETDPDFGEIYNKEKIRYDGNEDNSLFVKNIENVQGDERDIIIFSIAYARTEKKETISNRFGILNQENGENRLNVAISRAKLKIYLVTSIEPEELNVEKTKNDGPKLLKLYMMYSKLISEKKYEEAKSLLETLINKNINNKLINENNDAFINDICKELEKNGLSVHKNIGDSEYKIDIAILNKENSNYILGILCDGNQYKKIKSSRERDILQAKFLEITNWKIHRIWSRNWFINKEIEIKKILLKLKEL